MLEDTPRETTVTKGSLTKSETLHVPPTIIPHEG
jgi:hypothetical protein